MPTSPPDYTPNELLIYERKQRGWTQNYVATHLENPVDVRTVKRWERGETNVIDDPANRESLAKLFRKKDAPVERCLQRSHGFAGALLAGRFNGSRQSQCLCFQ